MHAVQSSYPQYSRQQNRIKKNVDYWIKNADAFLPGNMGPEGFGRWDVLIPSTLFLDLEYWKKSKKNNLSNGKSGEIVIAHCPNHRGFKGTEFIIQTIKQLQHEGFKVVLKIIENMPNNKVKKIMAEEADIIVEQIIFSGHGLNALEGMASGLPTICNLEDENYTYQFVVGHISMNVQYLLSLKIKNVLKKLIVNPQLLKIGIASRKYVDKYHGLDFKYFFKKIIDLCMTIIFH